MGTIKKGNFCVFELRLLTKNMIKVHIKIKTYINLY